MALKTVTSIDDSTGLVTVTPAGSSARDIAAALIGAADDPAQVRTATTATGMGWVVPKAVAAKAGILAKPKSGSSGDKDTARTGGSGGPKSR